MPILCTLCGNICKEVSVQDRFFSIAYRCLNKNCRRNKNLLYGKQDNDGWEVLDTTTGKNIESIILGGKIYFRDKITNKEWQSLLNKTNPAPMSGA